MFDITTSQKTRLLNATIRKGHVRYNVEQLPDMVVSGKHHQVQEPRLVLWRFVAEEEEKRLQQVIIELAKI